jgi:hypothetical protein
MYIVRATIAVPDEIPHLTYCDQLRDRALALGWPPPYSAHDKPADNGMLVDYVWHVNTDYEGILQAIRILGQEFNMTSIGLTRR